jgi:predicted nucleotidyltransferase component of viral defense system
VIPQAQIAAWGRVTPWPTVEQVEQDLLLARLIIEIANDDYLGKELVFRGGTCLHKLLLPAPRRYSEDLDYVRTTATGIGPVMRAVTDLGKRLDMTTSTQLTRHPKVYLRAPFESGTGTMRIKVEVNTYERAPARPLVHADLTVASEWFSGTAAVQTFAPEELIATKLRALYQRRKGRDLFDLWLALTELRLDPHDILECFGPYRPDGYNARLAEENLRAKVEHPRFREDLTPLVTVWPAGYTIEAAANLVVDKLFSLL